MAASSFTTCSNIIPAFVLVFLIFTAVEVVDEPPSMVPQACTDAYAVGNNSFTVDFCLSTLTGHRVGAVDYGDLALFAVDLTTANATATKARLDELVAGVFGRGPLFYGLRSCQDLYEAVVRLNQPACPRRGKGTERKVTSPIAKEDDDLAKLANLAIALAMV
ncbi:hypothetical protein EJB05_57333, partial [Eragrostis curvula]